MKIDKLKKDIEVKLRQQEQELEYSILQWPGKIQEINRDANDKIVSQAKQLKMHDFETVRLQEEFDHAKYQLQVDQAAQMKNVEKMQETVERMFVIQKYEFDT